MRYVAMSMVMAAAVVMIGDVAEAGLFGRSRGGCHNGHCGTPTYTYGGGGCHNGQCGTYYAPAPAKYAPTQYAPVQASPKQAAAEANVQDTQVTTTPAAQPTVQQPVYRPAAPTYRSGRRFFRIFR